MWRVAFVALAAMLLASGEAKRARSTSNTSWTNWDGRQTCTPNKILMPTTETAIVDALRLAISQKLPIKAAGDGHSFSPIVLTDGILLDLVNFNQIVGFTQDTVTAQAGTRIHDINAFLAARGRALRNLGAISMQSIVGATQTNTHGTGPTGGLATLIVGMRVLLANATTVELSATQHNDLFNAIRVGMGALGLVLTVTLETVPLWSMERVAAPMQLDDLLAQLPALRAQYERLQWYWTPYTTNATLLLRINTTAPIAAGCWSGASAAPLSPPPQGWHAWPEGTKACVDASYRTLTAPADDATLYTEMEMMVPAESDVDIIRDFRQFQESVKHMHDPHWGLFTGVRYVQPDDIWLSPFYGRHTAVVSMIVLGTSNRTAAANEINIFDHGLQNIAFSRYQGRPHPGKNNFFTAAEMAQVYPRFKDFVALRQALDPEGVFSNRYLHGLLSDVSV